MMKFLNDDNCLKLRRVAYSCYRAGLTHGVNGKKVHFNFNLVKSHNLKKRSDVTRAYLNWKERKTDSAGTTSKANDLKIFLFIIF